MTVSDYYLSIAILCVQLLVHAVTMYMVTAQTRHGKCTEMLLDPLSFLFDLLLHCTVSYIYL